MDCVGLVQVNAPPHVTKPLCVHTCPNPAYRPAHRHYRRSLWRNLLTSGKCGTTVGYMETSGGATMETMTFATA